MELQGQINPLKDATYGGGEPTGDAQARIEDAGMLRREAVCV
jgi:hypothetical protein